MSDSESSPKSSSSSSSGSDDDKPRSTAAATSQPQISSSPDEESMQYADPDSPGAARHHSSDESATSSDGVLVELPSSHDHDSRPSRGDSDGGILVNIDGSMQEHSEDNDGDRADDAGREETFVDAPDRLGAIGTPRGIELGESVALIEIRESSGHRSPDVAQLQARLDDTMAQCQKYKEEREVFGREIASLRHQLQELINQQSSNNEKLLDHLRQMERDRDEDQALSSPTPLHSMLDDCSKSVYHLKSILDEQSNSEAMIRELHSLVYAKDQEIKELNAKVSKSSVSHDVIDSYLSSLREIQSESLRESYDAATERLSASLAPLVGQEDGFSLESHTDGISLVEKQALILIEKHTQLLSEIQQLRQCLMEVKPDSVESEQNNVVSVLSVAREELFESKRKEVYYQEKLSQLKEENQKSVGEVDRMKASLEEANAETRKAKMELEQAEGKLMTAKEKLSIAVTKGKSLVQHRDSLKQVLAEKTSELEKCMLDLQQKSEALVATEDRVEELKQLFTKKTSELEVCMLESQQKSEALVATEAQIKELKQSLEVKTNELEVCLQELQQKSVALAAAESGIEELNRNQDFLDSLQESLSHRERVLGEIEEVISQSDSSQDLFEMDIVARVKWLVDQKHIMEGFSQQSHKIKDALLCIERPDDISSIEIESQINWLGKSLSLARDEIIKLQGEIANAQVTVKSHESELLGAHKEIDQLATSLLEEKQRKESLQAEINDLLDKYEEIAEKLSVVSKEKDGLMKVLLEISESTLGDPSSLDTDMLVERCLEKIKEKFKASPIQMEQFERMQSLLYVKDQELVLSKKILEEEMIDRSEIMNLSNELKKATEELLALRNEKDTMQKELERSEEKTSLLREKLSMAVKKGKGLVQEREGFKISLDEKNSEIEKLKHEIQLQHSSITEYKDQIKSLSAYPEQIQKLEADIISFKDQRDEFERILLEGNTKLQKVMDSIQRIALPTDTSFEEPVEKVNWIADFLHESEVAKAQMGKELEKVKEEATLQVSKLEDASAAIRSLANELSEAKMHISVISEEKKDIQLGKATLEQELQKIKEEGYMQASQLEHTYAAIKSLEESLLQAENNLSLLQAEKNEVESRSKQEIVGLNAKLAECMEELARRHGSLENQAVEVASSLGHLQMLMEDEGLFSLITDEFRTKTESLKNMVFLIHNMHEQFTAKGLHIHPSPQQDPHLGKLLSFPNFEEYISDRMVQSGRMSADLDDSPSLTKIIEGLHARAKFLVDRFTGLSKYLDDHIGVTSEALQATRNEFIHMLELSESLKVTVNNLEADKKAQETKMLSLEKEMGRLLSACTEATQVLQIDFHDLLDMESHSEQHFFNLGWTSEEPHGIQSQEEGTSEYVKAAESLLNSARRVRNQSHQVADVKRMWMTSIDGLREKLKQAELTAETAIQDKHLNQERVSKLEVDLEALQNLCNELKIKIEDYQAKEDIYKNKEAEFMSLQSTLPAKERGKDDKLFSEGQMETLVDKVNKLEIPFKESDIEIEGVHFLNPINKLFYIMDKASEFQHKMDKMVCEKEEMELALASHVNEIENLKNSAETLSTTIQDLELKKTELADLTSGMEKIIERLGGIGSFEDRKSVTAKDFLPVLERLMIASSMEYENSKSRVQELGAKLHAKEKAIEELSSKIKLLEDSINTRLMQPDTVKERTVFEASTSLGSEISEIEDAGPLGNSTMPPAPPAAHARTMRKGSTDHLVLSIDPESERLITTQENDDKGHVFKSLNTSGLIPKQGKLIADRIDGIWVSGGRMLMGRPGARLGFIAYWILLHLWVLGTIL